MRNIEIFLKINLKVFSKSNIYLYEQNYYKAQQSIPSTSKIILKREIIICKSGFQLMRWGKPINF